jgi:hypothetical protein
MYWEVVRKQKVEQKTALKIIVGIWLTCTIGTLLLSLCSPIYLMSAGTYCFFGFSSAAIAGWLVPGLVISLGTMLFCHITVMNHFKSMLPKVGTAQVKVLGQNSFLTNRDVWAQQFQWRSTLYMIVLLLGWGFAAVATVFELAVGRSAEWLVTGVGVGGVSFSWWCPLVYAHTSPYYRDNMKILFYSIFCCRKDNWETNRRILRTGQSTTEMTSIPSLNANSLQKAEEAVTGSPEQKIIQAQTCIEIVEEKRDSVEMLPDPDSLPGQGSSLPEIGACLDKNDEGMEKACQVTSL